MSLSLSPHSSPCFVVVPVCIHTLRCTLIQIFIFERALPSRMVRKTLKPSWISREQVCFVCSLQRSTLDASLRRQRWFEEDVGRPPLLDYHRWPKSMSPSLQSRA